MQPSDAEATVLAYLYNAPRVTFKAGAFHSDFLWAISSEEISNEILFSMASIVIGSPSRTTAIVPPSWASGVT